MAKNKDFKHEVIEHLVDLKEYNSGYTKSVMRMIWGDNPITMDIRMTNKEKGFVGKGISLTDDECDELVNVLIDNGYGSVDKMKEAVVKRMRRTNLNIKSIEDCGDEFIDCVYTDDDGTKVVDIPMYN